LRVQADHSALRLELARSVIAQADLAANAVGPVPVVAMLDKDDYTANHSAESHAGPTERKRAEGHRREEPNQDKNAGNQVQRPEQSAFEDGRVSVRVGYRCLSSVRRLRPGDIGATARALEARGGKAALFTNRQAGLRQCSRMSPDACAPRSLDG
jgi:hypothetical protein